MKKQNTFGPSDIVQCVLSLCDYRKYNVLALVYTILLQLIFFVIPGIPFLILYVLCKISEIRTKSYGEKPSEFILYCIILPSMCFYYSIVAKRKEQ